jgi:transcription elongation factor Elf1
MVRISLGLRTGDAILICKGCDAEIEVATAKSILLGKESVKPLLVCAVCGEYNPLD